MTATCVNTIQAFCELKYTIKPDMTFEGEVGFEGQASTNVMINSSELYKDGDKYRLRQQKFLKYLEPVLCTFKVFDNISQSKHIFSLVKFVKLLIATFGGYFGYK